MAEKMQVRVVPLVEGEGRTVDFEFEFDPYRVSECGIPDIAARVGAALDALEFVEYVKVSEIKGYSWEEVSYETPEPEEPEGEDPTPVPGDGSEEPPFPDDPPVSNS
jgi:hypothetical protein